MTNSHLKLVTPNSEIRTVPPRRPKNADVRSREHLTPGEVQTLIEARAAIVMGIVTQP
jgi:hypothetical protein